MVKFFAGCGVMGEGDGGRGGEVDILTLRRGKLSALCQEWCISYTSGISGCVRTQFDGTLIIILLLK